MSRELNKDAVKAIHEYYGCLGRKTPLGNMNILAMNLIIVSLEMDVIRPMTVVNVVRMNSMKAISVR